jgi:hypothetical protein
VEGLPPGEPLIVAAGMQGERASVVIEEQEQRQHRPRRNQESISLDSSGGMSA